MQGPFPAYTGKDPYVFVSYAHDDSEQVFSEIIHLNDNGFNIWYDEGIHPGVSWRQEIANRILSANWFAYFVSPRSVSSSNCIKEINFALDNHIPLVIIYMEETVLPSGLGLALGDIQALLKHELSPSSYERKLLAAFSSDANRTYFPNISPKSGFADGVISVAVLPFINMSNEVEQEYFCDGFTEEIINGLVKYAELKVIARTSSFEFKGKNIDVRVIGEKLNVNHVLEGSVRKSGPRVRITSQLVRVKDARPVWSEKYDRQMTDVFDLQDEITAEMVKSLGLHFNQALEGTRQKVNPEAFNELLLGRYHSYRMEYEPALVAYQKVLVLQENYADVHAGLAQVYDVQANISTDRELKEKADYHIQRALDLDPVQPMASCIQLQRDYLAGKLQPALDSFAELLNRGPNEYAVILFYESFLRCLRFEEQCLRLIDRLVELDPLNSLTYFQKGESLRCFGHFDAARRAYEQAGALGMPVEGILAVLAFDMRDADVLEVQLNKPAESWGIIIRFHELLRIGMHQIRNQTEQVEELLPNVIEAAKTSSYYYQYLTAFAQEDWLGAVEQLERGYREGDWLCFSHTLDTAGLRASRPEFSQFPAYLEFLQRVGMDAKPRSRLKVRPLPF